MSAKHTAGPWTIDEDRAYDNIVISDAEGCVVCEVVDDEDRDPKAMPRALLIAAAPELLEALDAEQSIHDDMRERGSIPHTEYMARKERAADLRKAALAKARSPS